MAPPSAESACGMAWLAFCRFMLDRSLTEACRGLVPACRGQGGLPLQANTWDACQPSMWQVTRALYARCCYECKTADGCTAAQHVGPMLLMVSGSRCMVTDSSSYLAACAGCRV